MQNQVAVPINRGIIQTVPAGFSLINHAGKSVCIRDDGMFDAIMETQKPIHFKFFGRV